MCNIVTQMTITHSLRSLPSKSNISQYGNVAIGNSSKDRGGRRGSQTIPPVDNYADTAIKLGRRAFFLGPRAYIKRCKGW
ncbi:hypothetical protein JTE90_019047 [Oedothorax gibbosus]|uniref:Uncharacterized protein n=1 Tax=Oedothorax gibbosus TaxID=931172 RepID=A0AAV6V006_9ARAC|nr:hypothetical protein JTE90_019047 [Oedothorax gibbosus]